MYKYIIRYLQSIFTQLPHCHYCLIIYAIIKKLNTIIKDFHIIIFFSKLISHIDIFSCLIKLNDIAGIKKNFSIVDYPNCIHGIRDK